MIQEWLIHPILNDIEIKQKNTNNNIINNNKHKEKEQNDAFKDYRYTFSIIYITYITKYLYM